MKKKIIILLSVVIILLIGIVLWDIWDIVSKLLFICLMATRQAIGIILLSTQMIQLEKIRFSILLQREILITAILKVS